LLLVKTPGECLGSGFATGRSQSQSVAVNSGSLAWTIWAGYGLSSSQELFPCKLFTRLRRSGFHLESFQGFGGSSRRDSPLRLFLAWARNHF
jgi:hypothetical protein